MSNGKKNFPRISIGENTGVLLVSLGLAIIIWIFVKAGDTETAHVQVPVVVSPKDESIELQIDPANVEVEVRFAREFKSYISSDNFRFDVDISDMRADLGLEWKIKSKPLDEKNLKSDIPGNPHVKILNSTVDIRARWKAHVAVVAPDIAGEDLLPEGLQLVRPIKVTPREVWIVGSPQALDTIPRDELTSKMQLTTERVNVAEAQQGALKTVAIKVPAGVEIIQPASNMAELNLDIQEVQTVREIRGVPLTLAAVFSDTVELKYSEKLVTVTVFGPQGLLRQLTPQSVVVSMIRPAEEVPGTTKDVSLEARFAESVSPEIRGKLTIRSVDPAKVRVTYVAKPEGNSHRP